MVSTMTTERTGYRTLFVQIPESVWTALAAEAEEFHGGNLTRTVTQLLAEKLKVPAGKLPPPKRAGRPRKQ